MTKTMNYFDLVVMYQELKESMKLAIKELQRYNNDYDDPSVVRASLNISKQQYKEIMK